MIESRRLDRIVFALLFASDEPLSAAKIASVLKAGDSSGVRASLERIRARLDDEESSIMLENVAGGYQLATRPEYADYVARLYSGRRKQRLSRAALETLAIIAYKQPITRAEIERVRGVSCGAVISTLLERSLIKIAGKARVLGAPFLYGTGREFLEYLGLESLKDLPAMEELEHILEEREEAAGECEEEEVSSEEKRETIEGSAPAGEIAHGEKHPDRGTD